MAWTHEPGRGSALKNDYKTEDRHPDFKGDVMTPDGKVWEIAEWEGETKDGRPRRSYRFSEPREAQSKFSRHEDEPEQPGSLRADLDDEIPFEMEWR